MNLKRSIIKVRVQKDTYKHFFPPRCNPKDQIEQYNRLAMDDQKIKHCPPRQRKIHNSCQNQRLDRDAWPNKSITKWTAKIGSEENYKQNQT